jgi:hypothetical protein
MLARSRVPPLEEIQPGRSALVVCKYRVERVLSGELKPGEILVAQWALLDSQPQPPATIEIGPRRQMVLERFGLNPQLEGYVRSDDFHEGNDPQQPRYYEINRP